MLATTPPNGDPQAIGLSGTINFLTGVHTLTFMDWPAEIGIDNLRISGCTSAPPTNIPRSGPESVTVPHCTPLQTPEPSTLPLAALGLGMVAFGIGRARRTALAR